MFSKSTEDKSELEIWRQEEANWWNRFSDIMNVQWELSAYYNTKLRDSIERDYSSYLLQPGKRFLDVGCGTGRLSLKFAELGMHVVGIDFSAQQIRKANEYVHVSGLKNVEFFARHLIASTSVRVKPSIRYF